MLLNREDEKKKKYDCMCSVSSYDLVSPHKWSFLIFIDFIKFNLPLELTICYEYKKLPYAHCSHGGTLHTTLKKIYNLGYRKLLIEGGLKTINFFIKENVIDEFFIVKNNKNFASKGLNSSKSFFNFKKSNVFQKLYLEGDTIFNYKLNNVYRYNSRNC